MMAKKTYSSAASFKYFNVYQIESFDMTFEKIRLRAANLLHREGLDYGPVQWSSILGLEDHLKKAWDYKWSQGGVEHYFRRYWLDRLVEEISVMLWNAVNDKYYRDWYDNGVELPEVNLPKKQRNAESICGFLADKVAQDFVKQYI